MCVESLESLKFNNNSQFIIDKLKNNEDDVIIIDFLYRYIILNINCELDFNFQDSKGYTILHYAIMKKKKVIIQFLLKFYTNVNVLDNNKNTLLLFAFYYECNDLEILKLLTNEFTIKNRNKQNVSVFDILINTPLNSTVGTYIQNNFYNEYIEYILDSNINLQTEDGKTFLINGILCNDINLIKMSLLKNELEINVRDDYGVSALHYAVIFSPIEIIKLLLKNKYINIDILDGAKETPLFYALRRRDINIINLLVMNDANIHITNIENNTLIDVARKNNMSIELINLSFEKMLDMVDTTILDHINFLLNKNISKMIDD